MSLSPNCKCLNIIPFHLPYKIPRTEGQKCSKSNQQQDQYTDFWPASKLWEWKFTVRTCHLGTMRQGRTNLKEKGSGCATGRRANQTTTHAFGKAVGTHYWFLLPQPRTPTPCPQAPKPTAAPSGADTKSNNFVLTSCLQARLRHYACRFCWLLLQSCPMRLTALKGNISLAKSRKMQSFHTAILHLTSLLLGYFNIFYFCLYQQTVQIGKWDLLDESNYHHTPSRPL